MSDFFQTGAIATLHRLGPTDLPRLERELWEFAKETPITLVCSIRIATKAFQEDPLWTPLMSNWNRVESTCPQFLEELREAVR